jgi:hypothetical protein
MKYIDYPELSRLANSISHHGPECAVHTRIEAYSCKHIKRDKRLFRDLEHAYAEEVSTSPSLPSWLALEREADETPFGPMNRLASRKTLYLLIATLNVAFPDYEFSDVRPAHFNKEKNGASVLGALSAALTSPRDGISAPRTYSAYPPTSTDFFPRSVPTSSSPMDRYTMQTTPSRSYGSASSSMSRKSGNSSSASNIHPGVYRMLDDVIGLSDCEVYSYVPDVDSDPHASDMNDSDDEGGSDDDYASPDTDDGLTFEFDDYDIDEVGEGGRRRSGTAAWSDSRGSSRSPIDSFLDEGIRDSGMKHRRGSLLWSSHWFFLNRKLNRILFVTLWARSRSLSATWADVDEDEGYGSMSDKASERFMGWHGAVGAGARALGLGGVSP